MSIEFWQNCDHTADKKANLKKYFSFLKIFNIISLEHLLASRLLEKLGLLSRLFTVPQLTKYERILSILARVL